MNRAIPNPSAPPVVLTIAGSDNSCGAGIQADLKTFTHFGVYGLTALTCIVAEVPGIVQSIQPVSPRIVAEQVALCLEHYPVAAIKTGMLYSAEIIREIVRVLQDRAAGIPLVVDPVMVATSGDALLQETAIALYEDELFPMATLVTPNLDEASVLLGGGRIGTIAEMETAGNSLSQRYRTAFLMKGGHLSGENATDLLVSQGEVLRFSAPYQRGAANHGTGCIYAAAIAASLALGQTLPDAIAEAKKYITEAIRDSFSWTGKNGNSIRALNHFRQNPRN